MSRIKWSFWVLGTVAVLTLGSGCKRNDAFTELPVPEARDENGWPIYEITAEGFAVALPPEWRQISVDPKTSQAKYEELIKKNPEHRQMLESARQQTANGVKFSGFNKAAAGGSVPQSVSVIRQPIPQVASLDMVTEQMLREYAASSNLAEPVSHQRLTLPFGDRERFRVVMNMTGPTGKTGTLVMTRFVAVREADVYILSVTTSVEQEDECAEAVEGIGRSFRLLK